MAVMHEDQAGWRKSSYSGSNGNTSCVEIKWRKSSLSGGSGNTDCVEVAFADSAVGVRDSKNTSGPTLAFAPTVWRSFAAAVSR
jgi:hypothetical protein